jgi:hypothetical protein
MSLDASGSQEESEIALKRRELELKDRELKFKELELGSPYWRSPIFVGLIAAALGLLGNVVATSLQNWNTQRVERYKAQSNLILEAIKTGDQEKAAKNLSFFLQLGFIDDEKGKIQGFLNKKTDVPVLPSSAASVGAPTMGVRNAKLALTALGIFKGKADGNNSDEFRAAIKSF